MTRVRGRNRQKRDARRERAVERQARADKSKRDRERIQRIADRRTEPVGRAS